METTSSFWTDTELNNWINDAGHDVAYKTRCIQTTGTMATVASTSEYTLSSYFTGIISVTDCYLYQNGTTWVKLDPTTRQALDVLHPGWKNAAAGVPSQYYFEYERNGTLGLYVKPNSTNAGSGYLSVYYGKDYTDLSADGDSPAYIPELLQQGMVEYVVATGLETRGFNDKANNAWQKYNTKMQEYFALRQNIQFEDDDIIMKSIYNI